MTGADSYFVFAVTEFRSGGGALQDARPNLDHCCFVLSGRGYAIVEGKRHDFGPNDILWIPGNHKHEIHPSGAECLRVIATLTGKDFNQTAEAFVRSIKDVAPIAPPNHVETSTFRLANPKNGGGNSIEFHISEIRYNGCAEAEVHDDADHMNYIISGRGYAICDGEKLELEPNCGLYMPKGTRHELYVTGEETLRMAVTLAPARKIMRL
jgi:mannose-6-phosphate isomerase-like protein (cupin superfamily)